ncbi:MAG: hypothetical protein AAFN94_17670 [Pseudomonadota bacterium]
MDETDPTTEPTDTPTTGGATFSSNPVVDAFIRQQIMTDMKNKTDALAKGEEYIPAPNAILLY